MLMYWVVILTPFGLFVYVFGNLSSTTSERLNSYLFKQIYVHNCKWNIRNHS